MSNASQQLLPVGLRYAVVFPLNSSGRPAASGVTVYEGLKVEGPKAFSLNQTEARKITHYGADRVLAVDYLPPNEGVTGELRVGVHDLNMQATLSGVQVNILGEAQLIGHATNKQGSEPQVGLMLYQQALDLVSGARHYRCFIFPRAICIPATSGMSENPEDVVYRIAPTPSTKHLWGATLTALTDGITEAQYHELSTTGVPNLVAFKGDGTTTVFSFPTASPALSTAKITVWKNGTVVSSGMTPAVDKITFTTAPALNDDVDVFYES